MVRPMEVDGDEEDELPLRQQGSQLPFETRLQYRHYVAERPPAEYTRR